MKWTTKLTDVIETSWGFEVYNKEGDLLGNIVSDSPEDHHQCVIGLDQGACPVRDGWEDGAGNTCNLNGWGAEE